MLRSWRTMHKLAIYEKIDEITNNFSWYFFLHAIITMNEWIEANQS